MSLKYTCPSCGTPWAMRDCAGNVSVSRIGKLRCPGRRNKSREAEKPDPEHPEAG